MDKREKTLILIVHGARTVHPPLINGLLLKFYNYYRVNTTGEAKKYLKNFKKYLETNTDSAVEFFDWSGGITKVAVMKASKKLIEYLSLKSIFEEIIIIGISMGGNVAMVSANNKMIPDNVKKIISIGTPHFPHPFKNIKKISLINVYSRQDNYVGLANKLLYLNRGKMNPPQIENIELINLKHGEYIKNPEIEHRHKKTTVYNLLAELTKNNFSSRNPE